MKKYPFRILPSAITDLDNIYDYLFKTQSQEIAEYVIYAIKSKYEGDLLYFPEMASPQYKIRNGLRAIRIWQYKIYYYFDGEIVEVLRILRTQQKIEF